MMRSKISIFGCLMFFNLIALQSQPGSLDSDLDADGIVTTDIGNGDDRGYAVAVQPDGKILVVGSSYIGSYNDIAISRYYPDGTLDNSFSQDGKITTAIGNNYDNAQSVALQANGKIVIAGFSTFGADNNLTVVRYHSDGTLDSTFGTNGFVITDFGGDERGQSLVIQPDQKILVAGAFKNGSSHEFAVVRYNSNGTLDSTFSTDGIVTTAIGNDDWGNSVALQQDGKIVVAGYSDNGSDKDFAVVRYNMDGSLDNTFSFDGKVTTDIGNYDDYGRSVIIQADGKIIVAGASSNGSDFDFAVVRYNVDGTHDLSFDLDGKVITGLGIYSESGNSVALQADAKIVVAGYSWNVSAYNFEVVRYNSNGELDSTFGTDGIVITDLGTDWDIANGLTIQPDGKILVAGYTFNGVDFDFALTRYISGLNVGIIDLTAQNNSVLIYPNPMQQGGVLEYTLTREKTLTIGIYDLTGRLIKSIISKENRAEGVHTEEFHFDERTPSGNYILRMISETGSLSIKISKY